MRPTSSRLPSACPSSSPDLEAVLEHAGPRAALARERDEALAEVAGRGHVEVAPQPARRAAVVGDAHDRGDRTRVAARAARQRDREPVPAAEGDDRRPAGARGTCARVHDSSSHGRRRRSARRRRRLDRRLPISPPDVAVVHLGRVAARGEQPPSSSAITTLRCWPPVQPTPIDRYDLRSCSNAGSSSANRRSSSSRKRPGLRLREHVVAHRLRRARRAGAARRSSAGSAGSGSRTRGRRRAGARACSRTTRCSSAGATPRARRRSSGGAAPRSSCTLTFDVSTRMSASPLQLLEQRALVRDAVAHPVGVRERVPAPARLVAAHEHLVGRVEEQHAHARTHRRAARRARRAVPSRKSPERTSTTRP